MKYKLSIFITILIFISSCIPPRDKQYNHWELCTYDLKEYELKSKKIDSLPSTSIDITSYGKFLKNGNDEYILLRNKTFKEKVYNSRISPSPTYIMTYMISIKDKESVSTEKINDLSIKYSSLDGHWFYDDLNLLYSYVSDDSSHNTTISDPISHDDSELKSTFFKSYNAVHGLCEKDDGSILVLEKTETGYNIKEQKDDITLKQSFSLEIPNSDFKLSQFLRIWDMTDNSIFALSLCTDNNDKTILKNVKINFAENTSEIIDFPYYSEMNTYMNYFVNYSNSHEKIKITNSSIRKFGKDFQSFNFKNRTEHIYVVYSKECKKFVSCHIPFGNNKKPAIYFKILSEDFSMEESYGFSKHFSNMNVTAIKFDGEKIITLEQADKFSWRF